MQELLKDMLANRYTVAMISREAGIGYYRLYRCIKGFNDLSESDRKKLLKYADNEGLLEE